LAARQQAVWQPLIDWAMRRYDAPLSVTSGVIPKNQSLASLRAFAAAVAEQDNFALTALHVATAACGSLVIGLALMEGQLDPQEAFAASQLDEGFQIEAWGEDAEQAERRRALAADIEAAARFRALLSA
jgi:chaperone required for assembly of F1-ATPase